MARIFKSDPIWHTNGEFVVKLTQFKSSSTISSFGTKTDFIRAAREILSLPLVRNELLVVPKTIPFQSNGGGCNNQPGQILLISGRHFDQWIDLEDRLDKIGLEIIPDQVEFHAGLLQNALRFTLEAKLSPSWNRLANYMIHSEDFLAKSYVEAVKVDLKVTELLDHYQVYMHLTGVALKWIKKVDLNTLNVEDR